ncbi:MAG: hypothetical protein KGZ93_03190 [Actinobacteria bacterium]|nr:hypothetical protein [Actinomycetota bacterium]
MLETLIRSKVMAKLLSFFMADISCDTYLRDISRQIDEPPSAVRRDLERLEALGLLRSRMVGNHKHFSVRREFALLPELRSLYIKTEGMSDFLSEELQELHGVQLAFVYGEFESRPEKMLSGLRLVVVGEVDAALLERKLAYIKETLAQSIECRQYGAHEFKRLLESKDPSLDSIVTAETIVLVAPEESDA